MNFLWDIRKSLSCEGASAVEQVFREAGESPQLEAFRICLGQTQHNPA